MRFGKRIRNHFMPPRRESESTGNSGLVAPDERSALLYADAPSPAMGEPPVAENVPLHPVSDEMPTGADPTQRMLTALGRFHIYVTKGQAGAPHTMWADECMTQLAYAIEVSLAQDWANLVEALTDTARILHSYENGGHAALCVPFLNDSYEILCLMVGDLIVDNVRMDVMDRWRVRYGRALKDLHDLGIPLVKDEEETSSPAMEAPVRETNVIPFELPPSRGVSAKQELAETTREESYLPFLRAADEDEEEDPVDDPVYEPIAEAYVPPSDRVEPTVVTAIAEEPVVAPVFDPIPSLAIPEAEPDQEVNAEVIAPVFVPEPEEGNAVETAIDTHENIIAGPMEELCEPLPVAAEEPIETVVETSPVKEAESIPEQGDLIAAFEMESIPSPEPTVSVAVETAIPVREIVESEPVAVAIESPAEPISLQPEGSHGEIKPVDPATLALLDSLSEDLAAIEQSPEAEHGPRWESMREKVSALERHAAERNLMAAPSICRTMMDLCRAAARRGVEGFVDTAYLFCEAYVQADRNPDSVVVKNWYVESAALLQAWTAPVTESADPTGRLLDTARTAMARGDLSGAKALALQAVALMAKGEAERAESRVQEAEQRLKQCTEAIDQARAAVSRTEQEVTVAESRVSEGEVAVNEARELVDAFQNKATEVSQRIAAIDEEIRRLQARRATEEEQARAIDSDLLRARQNEESVKRDLDTLVKAENTARTRLEDARQSVKDQQRRRSEQETALLRCRETLTRHRTSLNDIERAVTQVSDPTETASEESNGLLFE